MGSQNKCEFFCVAGNRKKNLAVKTAKRAVSFLEKARVPFVVDSGFLKTKNSVPLKSARALFFLVFGGDGTLLHVVREMRSQAPVLGINCGRRGHLMQAQPKQTEAAIRKILSGQFSIEPRSRLEICIDEKQAPGALNEVIVAPKKSFTLFDCSLSFGGKPLVFSSDAIAVATPTGSTAFAFSAGGKKIPLNKKLFEVLPVHSFNAERKPFFVSDSKKIVLKLSGNRTDYEAIIDGQKRVTVKRGVMIKKSSAPALFVVTC